MTGFLAVCLTITSPYIFRILKRFFIWSFGSRGLIEAQPAPTGERAPLLHGQASRGPNQANNSGEEPTGNGVIGERGTLVVFHHSDHEDSQRPHGPNGGSDGPDASSIFDTTRNHGLLLLLDQSESSRDFVRRCIKHILTGGDRSIGAIIIITLVFFGVFVAWTIVGILSAYIASDKTGLSASQHCGIWQFDDNAGDEAAYRDDLYNRQKEELASQYAHNCYQNLDPADTLSCNFFYNQSIGFETKTQQRCPFSTAELCYNGLYSAISFDTGLVDAKSIGVNSPVTFKFRRKTSCSPLNMSEPYIRKHAYKSDNMAYYYNYGSLDDVDYTFNTSGNPFEWLVPVYSA